MNEELQNALADLINKSVEIGGDALAFTQEQLPEVVQQLLLWKLVSSATVVLLAILVIAFFLVLATKILLCEPKSKDDPHNVWWGWYKGLERSEAKPQTVAVFAIGLLFCGFSFCALLSSGYTLFQILFAPKVYLIEYAARLAG